MRFSLWTEQQPRLSKAAVATITRVVNLRAKSTDLKDFPRNFGVRVKPGWPPKRP